EPPDRDFPGSGNALRAAALTLSAARLLQPWRRPPDVPRPRWPGATLPLEPVEMFLAELGDLGGDHDVAVAARARAPTHPVRSWGAASRRASGCPGVVALGIGDEVTLG